MSDTAADTRPTAVIPLAARDIAVFQPTDVQRVALSMAASLKDPGQIMVRICRVMESLMSPADWRFIDDGMVTAGLTLEELNAFIRAVIGHKWEDDATGSEGGA